MLVAAAQPIPGSRRIKEISKDIFLHLLGHSKVNKEAIKKIINFTVAEFVNKVQVVSLDNDFFQILSPSLRLL
ncbi:hypothetical protein QJS04_geneDACA004319 [Acorus gramineus]|uniref:Uncharacterized protein n=1 Tax=Acorus gramineus TaxID=55184 RepID=A0AAV9B4P8_ACOGR|nr:hypothetical protein QJS04_geneDACA004319 [Acorus gramineus]